MLKVSYNILHLVLILKVIFLIVRHGWTLALSMTLVRNILNIIACYFICQHAFPLGRKMKMWTWNWKSFEWLKDWRKVANMVRKKNRDDTSRTQRFLCSSTIIMFTLLSSTCFLEKYRQRLNMNLVDIFDDYCNVEVERLLI